MAAFIDLPVKVIFGRNKEDNIGAEVKYFGGSKVLLVYNLRFNQATGVTEKIRRSLEIFGIESVDFAKEFGKNPRVDVIREGIEFARQNYVDFVLALGSSHTVNLAKTIALGVANSVDIKEIFTSNRAYKDSLPVGVILTMPGNGVESTGKVYLYENDSDNLLKGSALTNSAYTPRFMILNPEIMNTSSIYTYSSCVYMLGQLIAKYLTSTEYVELLERDTEAIMNIVLSNKELEMLIDSVYTEKCFVCKDIISIQGMIKNAKDKGNEEEQKYFERQEIITKERLYKLEKLSFKLSLKYNDPDKSKKEGV